MSRRVDETENDRDVHCCSRAGLPFAVGRGLRLVAASLEAAFTDESAGLDIMVKHKSTLMLQPNHNDRNRGDNGAGNEYKQEAYIPVERAMSQVTRSLRTECSLIPAGMAQTVHGNKTSRK